MRELRLSMNSGLTELLALLCFSFLYYQRVPILLIEISLFVPNRLQNQILFHKILYQQYTPLVFMPETSPVLWALAYVDQKWWRWIGLWHSNGTIKQCKKKGLPNTWMRNPKGMNAVKQQALVSKWEPRHIAHLFILTGLVPIVRDRQEELKQLKYRTIKTRKTFRVGPGPHPFRHNKNTYLRSTSVLDFVSGCIPSFHFGESAPQQHIDFVSYI